MEDEDKKGCLIDFDTLKPGDVLFDISNGEVIVERIEYDDEDDEYPVKCTKERDHHHIPEQFHYTKLGKDYEHEIYPKVYTQDPFKYAFNIAREKARDCSLIKSENQLLCHKITILEMTLRKLGHTKDA